MEELVTHAARSAWPSRRHAADGTAAWMGTRDCPPARSSSASWRAAGSAPRGQAHRAGEVRQGRVHRHDQIQVRERRGRRLPPRPIIPGAVKIDLHCRCEEQSGGRRASHFGTRYQPAIAIRLASSRTGPCMSVSCSDTACAMAASGCRRTPTARKMRVFDLDQCG